MPICINAKGRKTGFGIVDYRLCIIKIQIIRGGVNRKFIITLVVPLGILGILFGRLSV
jgi:hypothetical protein